jgi:ferritin-like protein
VASEGLHERFEDLSPKTRDLHRAIVSLIEELDAVDWYEQRVEASQDEELKAVLGHHRDEEVEHAMMNLEWIRRNNPTVDAAARMYLFSDGPITSVEEKAKAKAGEPAPEQGAATDEPAARSNGSLGIGSLKSGRASGAPEGGALRDVGPASGSSTSLEQWRTPWTS